MTFSISSALDVLAAHGIEPMESPDDREWPEVGQITSNEGIYATDLDEVFGRDDEADTYLRLDDSDDPRLREWWQQLQAIIEQPENYRPGKPFPGQGPSHPPEPHCAWYQPIHFFGHAWGIYIRESCILDTALGIASLVDWRSVRVPAWEAGRHLLRAAFYVFFLHEQFHHKVESLGFRFLVSTGGDHYRPYKRNVYRATYMTSDCIEESLANAESIRRLNEPRYLKRVDPAIRQGHRSYLRATIPMQPPGYREGLHYEREPTYRGGLHRLQSQVLDGKIPAGTPDAYWSAAPNMITALADITADIYVVLPHGARPIFRPTSIDPGATISSDALGNALTRHHGYTVVPGGKGSHVKLKKPGAPTIILPGDRQVVSPGVVKQALRAVGGYPISRLPDLLEGKLEGRA